LFQIFIVNGSLRFTDLHPTLLSGDKHFPTGLCHFSMVEHSVAPIRQ
jgi:hypothetical protein